MEWGTIKPKTFRPWDIFIMATFAPPESLIPYLEQMTGRSDGWHLFDTMVLRGLVTPMAGVHGFWAIEALSPEEWRHLGETIPNA